MKGSSKNEVELARLRLAEKQEARRFAREQSILDVVKWGVWLAALWIPISAARPIVESLAGKDTEVTGSLTASLMMTGVTGLGWAVTGARSRSRGRALVRLRARAGRLGLDLDAESTSNGVEEVKES